ncbi:MAG: ParB/RepB/Spo0J family partition protein [Arenibacterium sp.]
MSRKRRIFDIDLPDDPVEVTAATPAPASRRGPMASAIAENADALKARQSAMDAIREENDALAHEFVALREAGHVVELVPLDQVYSTVLVRDRILREDEELVDLVTSIREIGLSNPIRVMRRPDSQGYELVQGYRRLSAYRALLEETGAPEWATIPALIMEGDVDISGLYRRMVDENVIRKDLSFAEMAHAVRNYLDDPGTEATRMKDALAALFQSAPYSKRSYIRSFAQLLEDIGDLLYYPTAIPRAVGVSLARELKTYPDMVQQLREALEARPDRDEVSEVALLQTYAVQNSVVLESGAPDSSKSKPKRAARSKTTFHMASRAGQVKCTAAPGRLEIKVDRDFSTIDRDQLQQAIASLIEGLEA